jgi:hypothetical protein
MTSDQGERIVLRDSAGTYYLIASEALAGARLPDDQVPALEEALEEAQGGEVRGFASYPSAQLWRIAPSVALRLTLPDPGPEDYRIEPTIPQVGY